MEGLTILFAEKYMAGHGFDLTAFLILSAVFTIFAFIAFIWAFVRECNTKKEGVKGDTVQYKIQVTNECSFIEFHNTFEIIEEYENNIYLIEYKNN